MSGVYKGAKYGLVTGDLSIANGVLKAALLKGYTPNYSAHRYVSDISQTLYISDPLPARTYYGYTSGGYPISSPIFFPTTPNDPGNNYHMIIFQSSGPAGGADLPTNQQILIACYDGTSTNNWPVNPIGGTVTVTLGYLFGLY